MGHLSIFLIDAVNSFLKNASITHFNYSWRQDPETTKFFKFVDYHMKWIVLPYSESYFEDFLVKFTNSPVFTNFKTIKRIAFENACESSLIV